MGEDKLGKHRKAEQRERPNAFDKWLSGNCHKAVSHEKLRNATVGKEKKIERILEK